MRKALLALLLLAGLTAPALAQVPRVKIETVRVGFRAGAEGSGAKANAWTPVYIDLTAGLDPIGPHTGSIFIDAPDGDGTTTTYIVPLPSLQAKETTSVPIVGYTRPGSSSEEINVTVRSPEGRTLATTRANRNSYQFRGPGTVLYLVAGVRASAMRTALLQKQRIGAGQPGIQPGMPPAPQPKQPNAPQPGGEALDPDDDFTFTDETRAFAFADSVVQLPPHWFGYAAVDLLVLNTGNDGFIKSLVEDKSPRKAALAEWVRRGGRILISVGRNHQLVKQLLEELRLIGVTLDGTVPVKNVVSVQDWARGGPKGIGPLEGSRVKGGAPGQRGNVDLVKLTVEPGRGVEKLLVEKSADGEKPVVVQAPFGLGRVMLIAFDLDTPPFTEWDGVTQFYKKLQAELEPKNVPNNLQFMPGNAMRFNVGVDQSDASSALHQRLESFDEVPVISFGWVALFILLYILVVGPLDYFILKKVVKRLELTWITFPTVVLLVSAIAYFTAYYLKGSELRINKVDVVDIVAELDPETKTARGTQATGTTWFTLFSPRIQSYTVGIEPSPGWAPEEAENEDSRNPYSVVTTWFGRPADQFGGRAPTGGLFRRSYDYGPDAVGLFGVPIQVWATKSFTATWEAGLPRESPLFTAELAPSEANPRVLSGSITSKLPVELAEVWLLYRGHAYNLGRLPPGQAVRIEDKEIGVKARDSVALDEWMRQTSWQPNVPVQPGKMQAGGWERQGQPVNYLIKPLLFGEAVREGNTRNHMARPLDQSWRLVRAGQPAQRDEVVLIGRPVTSGGSGAEAVTQDPANPSRLWLGALPGKKNTRTPLSGTMSQETYVRVFIPVNTQK